MPLGEAESAANTFRIYGLGIADFPAPLSVHFSLAFAVKMV
jgi:hypothetical protein